MRVVLIAVINMRGHQINAFLFAVARFPLLKLVRSTTFGPMLRVGRIISAGTFILICFIVAMAQSPRQQPLGAFAQDSLPVLIKRLQPAVVTIVTYDKDDKPLGRGTGFFVYDDYNVRANPYLGREITVVTARHVVKGAYTAEVRINGVGESPLAYVYAEDVDADLILMGGDKPLRIFFELSHVDKLPIPLQVSQRVPTVGERVLVIGTPLGYEQTVSDGIVSEIRNVEPYGKVIQITAPISPGSSGSPVFNMRGEIIGVAISQVVDGQNLNFAVPGERIQNLSKIHLLQLDEWSQRHEATKAALAEYDVGKRLQLDNELEEASRHFQRAAQLSPRFAFAWFRLGICRDRLGRDDESIKAFETAIRLDPNFLLSLDAAGYKYQKLHRYGEAIASFEKAAQVKRCCLEDAEQPYLHIGAMYAELKSYDRAAAAYKEALRIYPDSLEAHQGLGTVYFDQRRFPLAIEHYSEVVRWDQHNLKAHYYLGLAHLKLGHKAAALDEYKLLLNLDRDEAAKLFDEIYR